MAAKIDTLTEDKAINLYLAGEPLEQILATCGISNSGFHRVRTRRGIPSRKLKSLPVEQIAKAYRAGASENALAKQYGVTRAVIAMRLKEAGVERRGTSAAAYVRASNMTSEERVAQAAAANKASRMRRVPEIQKRRRALDVERQGRQGSEGEKLLRDWLHERGEHAQVERAIGPYNVDLAMLPVAVEVLGGGFHGVKTRHAERTPYILDSGWHLVMVWDHEGQSAIGPGAADYLISFLEEIRRNPPASCQYRVITGQGKALAASGREDNEFPLVPPPRGTL